MVKYKIPKTKGIEKYRRLIQGFTAFLRVTNWKAKNAKAGAVKPAQKPSNFI